MKKPVILVSKCIEFASCRYNGDMIKSELVKKLKEHCEFIPVCAEVEVGLGVPRSSIRLEKRGSRVELVQPATGIVITERMKKFSSDFLDSLKEIDGAILKGRSPSCGIKDVRFYSDKSIEIDRKHTGIFAEMVKERYPGYPVEDEGRLLDERIREHFLTRIFLFSSFREVEKSRSISKLIKFHETNKLLYMAYSQKEMRFLGNMLGNQKKFSADELFFEYFESLKRMTEKMISRGNDENVLLHAFGYVSKGMKKKEIEYFMKVLYEFRDGRIPVKVPISILKSQMARFETDYLENQTYFSKHPVVL